MVSAYTQVIDFLLTKKWMSFIPSASVTISNSAKTEKIEKTTVRSVKTDKIFFRI